MYTYIHIASTEGVLTCVLALCLSPDLEAEREKECVPLK